MNPDEKAQLAKLEKTVSEMSAFINEYFNPDGTPKYPIVIQPKDSAVTSASGSVRIETNLGPINVLIV